eukprot:GAHX01002399.1.p1 GENE.GAHX01002399.1~~GAHX01002399.1.p1  ORF type:complete len:485 (-),score=76.38 GAHX01002399.1:114-1568(-)
MTEDNTTSVRDLVMGKRYNLTLIINSVNEWKEAKNKSCYCVLVACDLTYNPYKHAPLVTVVIFCSWAYNNLEFVPGQIIVLKEATYQYFEGSYSLQLNISAGNRRALTLKTPSIGMDKFLRLFAHKNKANLRTRLDLEREIIQYEIFSTYLSTFCGEIGADVEYRSFDELTEKHSFQSVSIIGELYKEAGRSLYSNYPEFVLQDPENYTTMLFKANTPSSLLFLSEDIQEEGKNVFAVIIPNPTNIKTYGESEIKVKFSNLMFFVDTSNMRFGFLYTKFSSYVLESENRTSGEPIEIKNYDVCKHIKSFGENDEFLKCDERSLNKIIKIGFTKYIPLKFCLFNITIFQDCFVKCRMIDIVPCTSKETIVDFCKICKVSRNGEYNDDTKKLECKICGQGEFLFTIYCVVVIADSTEMAPILLRDEWIKAFLGESDDSSYSELRTRIQYFIDIVKNQSPTVVVKIDFRENLLAMRELLYFPKLTNV